VKPVLSMMLGVMTAIGGFVDIGNLVTSGITGARFGMTLTWAVLVGTIGMALFAEMAGRVTGDQEADLPCGPRAARRPACPWSTRRAGSTTWN
jgi:Mn2+/Fe2+ NRAMP family transporter